MASLGLPKKLYKYEAFTIQSLLNLKNQVVYFGPPSGFNDPYDCALKADIHEIDPSEIEKFRSIYLSKPWPPHVKQALEEKPPADLKPMLMRAARSACEDIIEKFIENRGVSCFSEVNDELLMWAHYADKYQGFCLEFDTETELFEKAKKVKYVDEMPKLNALSVFADGERREVLDLFCTKSKAWKYEREWRCIHSEAGTPYTYPAEALTGVYFGPNMPRDVLEIICLVLQGQNPNVKFWQGERSASMFKVEFQNFSYTSHLESENSGKQT
ncbi:MAG: DUF2971 domain-containing protein [Pseudomonadota bacterium]|uniref:DUF2971 domain-containing protein n=1 Tax=Methylophaga aminisulfidivorans TaxID=230105 RepID=UPI0024E27224|nr:DUF2971 domain-containing protein [Methylophaga aminisulfidivorans]MEC9412191.1 DUF2971 domain-containing protein [Pseudomonadota bacterium]